MNDELQYIIVSLWCVRCQYPCGILSQMLLKDVSQLQQWLPSRERGTLNQALLIKDKEVSCTGQDHPTALGTGLWEAPGS